MRVVRPVHHGGQIPVACAHDALAEETTIDANLRACIASIAARLTGQSTSSAVYDYTQRRHIHAPGAVSEEAVNVYHHERGAHVSGTPASLYDHRLGVHVSLARDGMTFRGHDFGSNRDFRATVVGSIVTIEDDETGRRHCYGVLLT